MQVWYLFMLPASVTCYTELMKPAHKTKENVQRKRLKKNKEKKRVCLLVRWLLWTLKWILWPLGLQQQANTNTKSECEREMWLQPFLQTRRNNPPCKSWWFRVGRAVCSSLDGWRDGGREAVREDVGSYVIDSVSVVYLVNIQFQWV